MQAQPKEKFLNFREHEARIWLQKHIAWACNNGHGVQICNEVDELKVEMKKAA